MNINSGVTVEPLTVALGEEFKVSFSLKEYQGGSKSLEFVQVWIQDGDGNDLYMAAEWSNQVFSPGQQRDYSTTTYLDQNVNREPGSYHAIVRGKIAEDQAGAFNFQTIDSGDNPSQFTVLEGQENIEGPKPTPQGLIDISKGVEVRPGAPLLGNEFDILFSLKEYTGYSKEIESIILMVLDDGGNCLYTVKKWENVSFFPLQERVFSATTYIDSQKGRKQGEYQVIVVGSVKGGELFEFGIIDSYNGVNPKRFNVLGLPISAIIEPIMHGIADKVINNAQKNIGKTSGSTIWDGQTKNGTWADSQWTYCSRFVRMCFGEWSGQNRATAYDAYLHFKALGLIQHSQATPPRGAVIFYGQHKENGYAGHVGVGLGNKQMLSVTSKKNGVNDTPIFNYFKANYLGYVSAGQYKDNW